MLYKNKYRSESARLRNWDYSSNGYYFVTICTHDRKHHFGTINDGMVALSEMGDIADKYWREIPDHFSFAHSEGHVIMPNHVHGIVEIDVAESDRICRDANNRVPTDAVPAFAPADAPIAGGITKSHNPMLNPFSLSKIIRWYKGRVAFEINKNILAHDFRWQSRFYDSILKTDADLFRVKAYIVNNPHSWNNDDLFSSINSDALTSATL
ncbi:MAG: transposase [Fibrobacterota bacterium]